MVLKALSSCLEVSSSTCLGCRKSWGRRGAQIVGTTTLPWKKLDTIGAMELAGMSKESPPAIAILHALIGLMGEDRAVMISLDLLSDITHFSKSALRRGIAFALERDLFDVVKTEARASSSLFMVNERVAWAGEPGKRTGQVRAVVVVREQDQERIKNGNLMQINVVEMGGFPRPTDQRRSVA